MTESPKNPGSEVEGAQPHMNPGEDVEGAQPHMNPGEDVEGAQPHMNPGEDVEGAQPHMDPSSLKTEVDIPAEDPSGALKQAAYLTGMGDREGQRGIIIVNSRGILIGLLVLFLVLFGFLMFGPPAMVMGAFNGLVSQDSFHQLACPSGTTLKMSPLVETGQIVPVSYSLAGSTATINDADKQATAPSFFDVFFFDVFNTANSLRVAMGGQGFFPPDPCSSDVNPPPQGAPGGYVPTTTPAPGAGVCGSTCRADADCKTGFICLPAGQCWQQACDTNTSNNRSTPTQSSGGGVARCEPGWLPASGCVCCGTTYTCADGTVAQFNPTCGVGGGGNACATSTCGDGVCNAACGEDINTCPADCHK